jgi:hypothetical protein
MRIEEVVQSPTPEQPHIRAVQAQTQQVQVRIKAECLRQQQTRLNQQRRKLAGI